MSEFYVFGNGNKPKPSEQSLRERLGVCRARFGWHSRELAGALRDFVDFLYSHGQKHQARFQLQEALDIMRDVQQQPDDLTLSSLIDRMAAILTEEGEERIPSPPPYVRENEGEVGCGRRGAIPCVERD